MTLRKTDYYFSVVMAVYNTAPFLETAIESLVHQTIGFNNIQLILVDDGSTDGSSELCDAYSKKYKDNIKVIHKENGGVSSARNQGLQYVEGRYLSFMDSDDKIDRDAFEKVYDFFESHNGETDVVSIPMKMFDGMTGDHPTNVKFDLEYDIVDLFETPYFASNGVSSFINASSVGSLRFDENLRYAEDSKFILSILMKKMTLGLLRNTTYWYRKRSSGEKSAMQSNTHKKDWYMNTVQRFHLYMINTSKEIFGYVPKFIQYQVMYDLQWRWKQNHIPTDVLTAEEKLCYIKLLESVTKFIEDDVIYDQKSINNTYKINILKNKYEYLPEVNIIKSNNYYYDNKGRGIASGDAELRFSDSAVFQLSKMKTVLSFLTIEKDNSTFTIEGYHEFCCSENVEIIPLLIVNNIVYYCKIVNRKMNASKSLDNVISRTIGFEVTVPLKKGSLSIFPAVIINDTLIITSSMEYGEYFPVCDVYKNSYALSQKRMIIVSEDCLLISGKSSVYNVVKREIKLICEIWKKNYLGGRKAVFARFAYHLYKPFKRHKIWLVSDRVNKADDNGEAMFRYIVKNKPQNTNVIFSVSKTSKDYSRLKKIGKCVDSMSFHHKFIYLLSDLDISSHAGALFGGYNYAVRDLIWEKKFVFLPHGVTKEDVSVFLNRYRRNIDGFVTVSDFERNAIVKGDYGYSESQVWLTGHPRYDYLYHNEKNFVTLLPTWRQYLFNSYQDKTGEWDINNDFEEEEYFKFYNELINSERLLSALSDSGYTLQFFPNPNMQRYINRFKKDPRVVFLPLETIYRDVLAQSKLVVTDYSAAVFDFAYLKKPVVYCQFDKERYFSEHYLPGYYNYERDGFGEVVYNLEDTIDFIIEYVNNGCHLKDKYRERIEHYFAFNDNNNCKRVFERIQSL